MSASISSVTERIMPVMFGMALAMNRPIRFPVSASILGAIARALAIAWRPALAIPCRLTFTVMGCWIIMPRYTTYAWIIASSLSMVVSDPSKLLIIQARGLFHSH